MLRCLLAVACALLIPAAAHAADRLVGLTAAIITAERQMAGRAIDGELETRSGKLVYEIELVRTDTLHQILIDARTGQIIAVSRPRLLGIYRRWLDGGRMKQAARVRPLGPMLQQVERQPGRVVHDATLKVDDGRPIYEVEVETPTGVVEVTFDALTGQRLTVALDDDDD
ncbi:PepSY domain-containing protein [Sphingomonas sanxanigenens]|uniref:PepSY domain-containing protein n=1 Tax=Sphingomonas sanxanigenens TaxID=397260 RepID=UPI0005879ADC|nr:PepSY domain-containing protein [Sphingomonas sanxanigenens]